MFSTEADDGRTGGCAVENNSQVLDGESRHIYTLPIIAPSSFCDDENVAGWAHYNLGAQKASWRTEEPMRSKQALSAINQRVRAEEPASTLPFIPSREKIGGGHLHFRTQNAELLHVCKTGSYCREWYQRPTALPHLMLVIVSPASTAARSS